MKRGTNVVFTGLNTDNVDPRCKDPDGWREKQIEHYYDKYGIEVGNKGKTCGGYSGGWVKISWTLSDGSKVSSVPMRSEHFSKVDRIPQSEHLIDFEEYSGCELGPDITLTEQITRSNLLSDIRGAQIFTPEPVLRETVEDCDKNSDGPVLEINDEYEETVLFSPVGALRSVLKQTRLDKVKLTEENKALRIMIIALEASVVTLDKKNVSQENDIIDLKRISVSLAERLELAEKETSKYVTKCDTLKEEIGFWVEDLDASEKKYLISNTASMELAAKCAMLGKDLYEARAQADRNNKVKPWSDYSEDLHTQESACQSEDDYYQQEEPPMWCKDFSDKLEDMNSVVGKYKMIIDVQQDIMMTVADKLTTQGLRISDLEEKAAKDEAAKTLQSVSREYIKNKRHKDDGWQLTNTEF